MRLISKPVLLTILASFLISAPALPKSWPGFQKGMGIGGWLTNYKRFNVIPDERRMILTIGDYEHFDSFITEDDVVNIASMGFDHIRVGFDQIVVEESPFKYRDRTMKLLEDCAIWCEKHHLNVVFNLHKSLGNYCDIQEEKGLFDDKDLQDRFVALWAEMERRFHDHPAVAFELLNEVQGIDPAPWNELVERTVSAIRALNKDRVIVIGPVGGNYPQFLKHLKIYDDPNIVYTFHFYDPDAFTHQQGVLKADQLFYNRKMPYPCDDVDRYRDYKRVVEGVENAYEGVKRIDKEFLRDAMQSAFEFAKEHPDKVLWAGEFGTIRHAKIEWREAYMNDMISLFKENGLPYCVWNYLSTPNDGNRFSLVDDDTRKVLSPRLQEILLGNVK